MLEKSCKFAYQTVEKSCKVCLKSVVGKALVANFLMTILAKLTLLRQPIDSKARRLPHKPLLSDAVVDEAFLCELRLVVDVASVNDDVAAHRTAHHAP